MIRQTYGLFLSPDTQSCLSKERCSVSSTTSLLLVHPKIFFANIWTRTSSFQRFYTVSQIDIQECDDATLLEFFDLLDLDGGGSIDPGELAQSYLHLSKLLDDPKKLALFRTAHSMEAKMDQVRLFQKREPLLRAGRYRPLMVISSLCRACVRFPGSSTAAYYDRAFPGRLAHTGWTYVSNAHLSTRTKIRRGGVVMNQQLVHEPTTLLHSSILTPPGPFCFCGDADDAVPV